MDTHNGELAALVGSRICHDLISPIGAINNGLELLDITGETNGPEMDLISESVGNADARIKFFRIAYGAASDQLLGSVDVQKILDGMSRSGRTVFRWDITRDLQRSVVRALFLAIQCCETAMPYGGTIVVEQDGDGLSVTGSGQKITVEEALWTGLSKSAGHHGNVTPASVQFALLPLYAADMARRIRVHSTPNSVSVLI